MVARNTWRAALALAALIVAAPGSMSAALVTQTITGSFNDGSFGLAAFPTLTPNPMGLTDASVVSGFVTYDDAIVPGGGNGTVGFDGSNFNFEFNVGAFSANPFNDSFGSPFPLLIFDGGKVVGIDLVQDNTNGQPIPCSGALLGIQGDWCEFGMGPGAFFGTGAQAMRPDIFAFEFVQEVQGGNNLEVKFFEGLMTFSDPTPGGPDVPEPGTFILLGSALVGFGVYRRRKQ